MNDLMTEQEHVAAANQGWLLLDVFNQTFERWQVQVLPLRFDKQFPNADAAAKHVIHLARSGHMVAQKALSLVMASHAPPTQKGKK